MLEINKIISNYIININYYNFYKELLIVYNFKIKNKYYYIKSRSTLMCTPALYFNPKKN